MKLNPEERVLYIQAVWETFQKQAQTKRDASNREYYYMARWLDGGIPLAVVLQTLDELSFRPRRLEAVDQQIGKAFTYWKQAMGMEV